MDFQNLTGQIRINRSSVPAYRVNEWIENKMLVLPALQPEWTAVEKSHFIETLMAGLVQPQLLLDARNRHTAVVTGGEWVVALRQFMTGQFALTAPCIFGKQAGLFYPHFPRNLQRAMEQAVLQVLLIAPDTTQTGYEQIQTLLETGAFSHLPALPPVQIWILELLGLSADVYTRLAYNSE